MLNLFCHFSIVTSHLSQRGVPLLWPLVLLPDSFKASLPIYGHKDAVNIELNGAGLMSPFVWCYSGCLASDCCLFNPLLSVIFRSLRDFWNEMSDL